MDRPMEMDHWTIGKQYNEILLKLGKLEEEIEKRRKKDVHLIKSEQITWRGNHATLVAAEQGFNVHNFHSFFHELQPETSEGAYHMHGEAIKFYMKGKGKELIGGKEYDVEAGDVILVPQHTWHGTQNPSKNDTMQFFAVAHSNAGAPLMRHPIFRTRQDLEDERLSKAEKENLVEKDYGGLGSWDLSLIKHRLLHDLGTLEVELERRRETERHLMRKSELEWADLKDDLGLDSKGPPYRIAKAIAPELGFKAYNFSVSFLEVPAKKNNGVYLAQGETVKVYTEGKGTETVGDKEYQVKAGDVVFVPANTWQCTKNPNETPLRVVMVTHARGIATASPVVYKAKTE